MLIKDMLEITSPKDFVCIRISDSKIIKKSTLQNYNPANVIFEKADKFLSLGQYPVHNPTYWNSTLGLQKDSVDDWQLALTNELKSYGNLDTKTTELDNVRVVMEVSGDIFLLAVNLNELTDELYKEIKCAKIHTSFGPIDVEV